MKTLCLCLLAVGLILSCTSCGKKSHEALMNDMIASMKEMGTILEGIKDKDTAKAAVPKLQEIAKRFQTFKKDSETLGEPDEATKKALEGKMKELMEVAMKMAGEMMRIQSIPGAAEELQAVQKDLEVLK